MARTYDKDKTVDRLLQTFEEVVEKGRVFVNRSTGMPFVVDLVCEMKSLYVVITAERKGIALKKKEWELVQKSYPLTQGLDTTKEGE